MVRRLGMVRPKSENPKTRAIQIRLTPEDQAIFDRLLAAYSADAHGVEIKAPALIRALVMKDAAARGLLQPKPAAPASKSKSSSPAARPGSTRPKGER